MNKTCYHANEKLVVAVVRHVIFSDSLQFETMCRHKYDASLPQYHQICRLQREWMCAW